MFCVLCCFPQFHRRPGHEVLRLRHRYDMNAPFCHPRGHRQYTRVSLFQSFQNVLHCIQSTVGAFQPCTASLFFASSNYSSTSICQSFERIHTATAISPLYPASSRGLLVYWIQPKFSLLASQTRHQFCHRERFPSSGLRRHDEFTAT